MGKVNLSVFRGRNQETWASKSVGTGGTTTLTAAEAMHKHLKFTGAIATAVIVQFPITPQEEGMSWWIDNATTNNGSTSLTIKGFDSAGAATTGIAITQAKKAYVVWDGTEFRQYVVEA